MGRLYALAMIWIALEISNGFYLCMVSTLDTVAAWNIVLRNIVKVIFGKNTVTDYLCLPRA